MIKTPVEQPPAQLGGELGEPDPELISPAPPTFDGIVGRALDGLSGFCLFLASVALVVLVAVFGWLVFGRYVLNNTPTWVEQLSLLLVVVITFLGSATLIHEDRHLGVTFIRDALPEPLRMFVRLLCDVALLIFGSVMAVVCSELVAFSWGNTLPMLGIPEGVRSLPAVICGALIALFSGCRVIAGLMNLFGRRFTMLPPGDTPST